QDAAAGFLVPFTGGVQVLAQVPGTPSGPDQFRVERVVQFPRQHLVSFTEHGPINPFAHSFSGKNSAQMVRFATAFLASLSASPALPPVSRPIKSRVFCPTIRARPSGQQ